MGTMLFETANRDESHQKLEEVLKEGLHPAAECREDPNAANGKFYQVWSGPVVRETEARKGPSAPPEVILSAMSAEDLAALADLIAKKQAGG
jgi:hypothetical protein